MSSNSKNNQDINERMRKHDKTRKNIPVEELRVSDEGYNGSKEKVMKKKDKEKEYPWIHIRY